jgi:hypothetical protein
VVDRAEAQPSGEGQAEAEPSEEAETAPVDTTSGEAVTEESTPTSPEDAESPAGQLKTDPTAAGAGDTTADSTTADGTTSANDAPVVPDPVEAPVVPPTAIEAPPVLESAAVTCTPDSTVTAEPTSEPTTVPAGCTPAPVGTMTEPAELDRALVATVEPEFETAAVMGAGAVRRCSPSAEGPVAWAVGSTNPPPPAPVEGQGADRSDVALGDAPPAAPTPEPRAPLMPVPALPPPLAPVSGGPCAGTWVGGSHHAAGFELPVGMLSCTVVMAPAGLLDQISADRAGCTVAGAGDPAVSPD